MKIFNKFKRGLAALLSLSVAMSAVFVFRFPLMKAYAASGHTHELDGTYGGIEWTEWTETDRLPGYFDITDEEGNEHHHFYLKENVTLNNTWTPVDGTYLCLNGHTISMNDNGNVINVNGGFTLCDCKDNKGKITHADNCNDGRGVEVKENGEFNMYGGAISGNEFDGSGAGVCNNATFNMYGGEISGNNGTDGAGVYNNNGEFVMRDGKISDNKAANYNSGGGVFNYFGTFVMRGGEISGNYVHGDGGGVHAAFGTFEMYGGKITGNECYGSGGGVNLTGTAKMTVGGTPNITGNKSKAFDSTVENNVYLPVNNVITISKSNPLWGTETKIGVTNQPNESGTAIAYAEDGLNYRMFFSADYDGDDRHSAYPENNGSVVFVNTNTPPEDAATAVDPEAPKPIITPENPDNPPTLGEEHKHGDEEFTAVSTEEELKAATGKCYLKNEITLTETWTPADGTVLCLNGHSVTASNISAITVANDNFTLCDCGTNGGNKIDCVYLHNGKIITLDAENPLKEGAEIHVRTDPDPTADNPIAITGQNDDDYSGFFSTDIENCEFKTVDGVVMLAVKGQETPGKHKHDDETEWKATALPTESGHYYLTQDVIIPADWAPEENTYICLNGHNIGGTISNSNVTLCNCKNKGTAAITVSADKTITLGGTLDANIKLGKGALIDVDTDNAPTGTITVTLTKAIAEGDSAQITTANGGAYSACFKSGNTSYIKKMKDGAVWFKRPVTPVTKHTHPICGNDNCKEHKDITWTAWNSATTLPSEEGSYYLTGNVTLGSRWEVRDGINLCLNGYIITMNYNDTAVYITDELHLCDCNTRTSFGAITHASGKSGRGVYIARGAALVMYSGDIRGNRSDNGAGVYNDGTFDMYGGYIMDNSASKIGGGLYNNGFATIEGEISKNTTAKKAGGVYQDGKLTVNKGAYIMNNTVGSNKSNVYITEGSRITIGTNLNGEVGVSAETYPQSNNTVTFAKGSVSSATASKLKSDSNSYTIKKSGDVLTLSKKSTVVKDDDYKLDILCVESSQVPREGREAIIELLQTMPDWIVGVYYDVVLYEDDEEVDVSDSLLDVKLTIPSSIRAANREYKVIRAHNGEATLLGDIDSNPNTVTVRSRYFSTYAVIYKITNSGTSDASASGTSGNGSGSNGGNSNPAMGVRNDIPISGLACGFTALALAAPGKKFENV